MWQWDFFNHPRVDISKAICRKIDFKEYSSFIYSYLVWLHHNGMREKLRRAWRFNYLSHFLFLLVTLGSKTKLFRSMHRNDKNQWKERSRSKSRLTVKALHNDIYIYIYVSYSQCKSDGREERELQVKRKRESSGAVCVKWMQRWQGWGWGVCGGGQSDAEDGRVEPLVERDHRFALATSFLSASLLFINVSQTV